jgi:hypothetical protein
MPCNINDTWPTTNLVLPHTLATPTDIGARPSLRRHGMTVMQWGRRGR